MLFELFSSLENSMTVIAEPFPAVEFGLMPSPLAAGPEEYVWARAVLKCTNIGRQVSEIMLPMSRDKDVD